jgi:hypothetical protein
VEGELVVTMAPAGDLARLIAEGELVVVAVRGESAGEISVFEAVKEG